MIEIRGPDDGGVHPRVREREPQRELDPRGTVEEVVESRPLPHLAGLVVGELGQPPRAPALVGSGVAPGHAAADDGSPASRGGPGDQSLVLALHEGVGDLEHVEHAHLDVIGQIGEDTGHADESHLAVGLQPLECLDCAVLLEVGHRGAPVELDDVDAVGPHPSEALLDPGHHVVNGVDVLAAPALARSGRHDAAALRGQHEFVAPARYRRADQLLAGAVVR